MKMTIAARLFPFSLVAVMATASPSLAEPQPEPSAPCSKGAIPVCVPKWDWDCIEGTEVVPDNCDVNDFGCTIEQE
jgi:hypothetical protein